MFKINNVIRVSFIRSVLVFFIVAVLTTLFEYSKELISDKLTIWESHTITICVVSICSFITAFYFYQHKYLKKSLKTKLHEIMEKQKGEIENIVEQHELNKVFNTKPFFFFQRQFIENQHRKAQRILSKMHKELELKKQSERSLLELNATKNKFFSIIVHDLKNPFFIVLGMSELLVKRAENSDKQRIIQQANEVYQSAKKAYLMMEDLLAWAKSQIGRLALVPEKININQLVNKKIDKFYNQTTEKNLLIINNCIPEHCAYADRPTTQTIMRNLISNAIKFSNQGNQIQIKTEIHKNMLNITVSDTGIGIDPNDITKLFRIDEQISRLGTNNEKGTGLGLILCKEFAEKNGGQIKVESTLGKGSDFILSLPLGELAIENLELTIKNSEKKI